MRAKKKKPARRTRDGHRTLEDLLSQPRKEGPLLPPFDASAVHRDLVEVTFKSGPRVCALKVDKATAERMLGVACAL